MLTSYLTYKELFVESQLNFVLIASIKLLQDFTRPSLKLLKNIF